VASLALRTCKSGTELALVLIDVTGEAVILFQARPLIARGLVLGEMAGRTLGLGMLAFEFKVAIAGVIELESFLPALESMAGSAILLGPLSSERVMIILFMAGEAGDFQSKIVRVVGGAYWCNTSCRARSHTTLPQTENYDLYGSIERPNR
jgi:hypothetical protein